MWARRQHARVRLGGVCFSECDAKRFLTYGACRVAVVEAALAAVTVVVVANTVVGDGVGRGAMWDDILARGQPMSPMSMVDASANQ